MKTLAFMALALGGACAANMAPSGSLENSLSTIRAAQEVGAANVPRAKLHLQLAEEQSTYAKKLIAEDENERASFVTMRSEADAQLALALARQSVSSAAAKDAVTKLAELNKEAQ
jgi:hypothetical protein